MVLADLGADVIRITRPGVEADAGDVTTRNRTSVAIDLRNPAETKHVMALVAQADMLIEGFRPGVMERLGLGPASCLAINPKLVYGRMTGWGQTGPLSQTAGHDINYIAITGALNAIGRANETPPPPLNYVGDFGGGGMLLAVGLLSGLHEARSSGKGQVVDAAMTDGTAILSAFMYGMKAMGQWTNERSDNVLDGGAHFYDTYACADGKFVALGAIEPQFYTEFLRLCSIDDSLFDNQMDRASWPIMKLRLSDIFRSKTRDQWCEILEGSDACFAPVLDWDEAALHPHNVHRETYFTEGSVLQPSPAPRFSRTPNSRPIPNRLATIDEALQAWISP